MPRPNEIACRAVTIRCPDPSEPDPISLRVSQTPARDVASLTILNGESVMAQCHLTLEGATALVKAFKSYNNVDTIGDDAMILREELDDDGKPVPANPWARAEPREGETIYSAFRRMVDGLPPQPATPDPVPTTVPDVVATAAPVRRYREDDPNEEIAF